MDWFHCNRCWRQEGRGFIVSSCGHVLCQGCRGAGPCPVCGANCRFLPIGDKMRPQEQLFFRRPSETAQQRLALLAQVGQFQRSQFQLLLQEVQAARKGLDRGLRELEALRRENAELRRNQLSPCWGGGSRNSTPRPIGVTSPAQSVTPQPCRQLSGQVVSRLQHLNTPTWQQPPRPSPRTWAAAAAAIFPAPASRR